MRRLLHISNTTAEILSQILPAEHDQSVALACISTRKLLELCSMQSELPRRVSRRLMTCMAANWAGTKHPACAMTAIIATWRRYVDLPAMLGPVMMWKLVQSAHSRYPDTMGLDPQGEGSQVLR